MTKLLTLCAVLMCLTCAGLAQGQGYQAPSVVVGQTPEGRNLILTVITLKFLDPVVAAQLFGGLGASSNAYSVPNRGGGEYDSTRGSGSVRPHSWGSRSQSGNTGTNGNSGNTGGYGGYGQALQQGQQYPGYQSPYGNR